MLIPGKGIATGILKYLEDWLGLDWLDSEYFKNEEQVKTTQVEVKPLWSLFKFLNKPHLSGLENIRSDKRPYFTIPLGVMAATGKHHYVLFPAGGLEDEISEISCRYNIASSDMEEDYE